ncbi:MAG: hypothetical protein ACYDH9_25280 [Limisphaerales bacterium]
MRKIFLPLLALPWLIAGCSTTLTNLTPAQMPRNAAGLYPFEVAWHSSEHDIVKESIKPYVVIGLEAYPLQPTPVVKNRWQTLVPIPADKEFVNYRYKFDYEYLSIPQHRANSKLSPPYQLQLQNK